MVSTGASFGTISCSYKLFVASSRDCSSRFRVATVSCWIRGCSSKLWDRSSSSSIAALLSDSELCNFSLRLKIVFLCWSSVSWRWWAVSLRSHSCFVVHCHFCLPLKGRYFLLEGYFLLYQAFALVHRDNILVSDGSETCLIGVCPPNQRQDIKRPGNFNLSGFAVFTLNVEDSSLHLWLGYEDFRDLIHNVSNFGMHAQTTEFLKPKNWYSLFL